MNGTKLGMEKGSLRLSAYGGQEDIYTGGFQPTPWPEFTGPMVTDGLVGFRLQDIPVPAKGSDLLVLVRYKGQPLKTLPANRPRETGISLTNSKTKAPIGKMTAYLPSDGFDAGFFFSTVAGGNKDLDFVFRGTEPVWIESIQVFAHPDVMIREFEKGLVLVNPSDHPYTFDLEKLTPGKRYRRLRGSSQQDPKTNDGSPVEGTLTLEPRDGLFLIRDM